MDTCKDCRFWKKGNITNYGVCHYRPEGVNCSNGHWCSKYEPKLESWSAEAVDEPSFTINGLSYYPLIQARRIVELKKQVAEAADELEVCKQERAQHLNAYNTTSESSLNYQRLNQEMVESHARLFEETRSANTRRCLLEKSTTDLLARIEELKDEIEKEKEFSKKWCEKASKEHDTGAAAEYEKVYNYIDNLKFASHLDIAEVINYILENLKNLKHHA